MSDWRDRYEYSANVEASKWASYSTEELLKFVRKGRTGEYHAIWPEIAKRPATPELCWALYDVLLSDRPYLDRYHCAAALLSLLECKEFEAVALSAGWPAVKENLALIRELLVSQFGEAPGK